MKEFQRKGHSVRPLDFAVSGITTNRVADFEISIGGKIMSVEVYSPQQWSLVKEFERSLHDSLIHFDSPFSFIFSIGAVQESRIRDRRNYVADPATAHRATTSEALNDAISDVLVKLSRYLEEGDFSDNFRTEISIPGMGFNYEVTVKDASKLENSLNRGATGTSSMSMPGGYLEDAFQSFCSGKLAAKIRKNQAGHHRSDIKCLFVNLEGMDVMHSYRADEYHTQQAQMILKQSVRENKNYDAICFFLYKELTDRQIIFPIGWYKDESVKDVFI